MLEQDDFYMWRSSRMRFSLFNSDQNLNLKEANLSNFVKEKSLKIMANHKEELVKCFEGNVEESE